ncbi:MAG: RagB/SusD family nutrient uptake outer membrane protein [Ignavibacteria bacterium]|jgi:hypothetical protein
MKKIKNIITIVLPILLLTYCDNPLELDPKTEIAEEEVFTDAEGAQLALYGCYSALHDDWFWGHYAHTITDLISDDLIHTGSYTSWSQIDKGQYDELSPHIDDVYEWGYAGINRCNLVIANLPGISMDESEKNKIMGEAHFIRGFIYFTLVNYFAGVPLVTTPTVSPIDDSYYVSRASVEEVYNQVESDLTQAESLLQPGNSKSTANKNTASALLARVYLYQGKYNEASEKASEVINSGYYYLDEYNEEYFDSENEPDIIFALIFTREDENSCIYWYTHANSGGRFEFAVDPDFYSAIEPGDLRMEAMIKVEEGVEGNVGYIDEANGVVWTIKYDDWVGRDNPVMILRLPEMYLIRAEAALRGAAGDPLADINVIRSRAGLSELSSVTLEDVLQERRMELCFEGHRFFDVARLGDPLTEFPIQQHQLIFPIPYWEIDVNPNITQNPGY